MRATHLVTPPQHITTPGLDQAINVKKLIHTMLSNILDVLEGLVPSQRGASFEESHCGRRSCVRTNGGLNPT